MRTRLVAFLAGALLAVAPVATAMAETTWL
jgi:hypothetical protein